MAVKKAPLKKIAPKPQKRSYYAGTGIDNLFSLGQHASFDDFVDSYAFQEEIVEGEQLSDGDTVIVVSHPDGTGTGQTEFNRILSESTIQAFTIKMGSPKLIPIS